MLAVVDGLLGTQPVACAKQAPVDWYPCIAVAERAGTVYGS